MEDNGSAAGAAPLLDNEHIVTLVRYVDADVQECFEENDDEEVFENLKRLGIIVAVEGGYNPDKHNGPYDDFLNRGDDYYEPAPWFQKAVYRLNKPPATASESGTPISIGGDAQRRSEPLLPATGVREALEKDMLVVIDALQDSKYMAGLTAGWNAAQADDPNAAKAKIEKAFEGYLSEFMDVKRRRGEGWTVRDAINALSSPPLGGGDGKGEEISVLGRKGGETPGQTVVWSPK